MSEPIHILSLGAGVQSSTMALMAAKGEVTPMPVAAIFADTQAEPQNVYRWLDWLEKQLPFPVHRVTAGNLADDSVRIRTSRKSGRKYMKGAIPAFVSKPGGGKGLLGRQCTADYKVRVLTRCARGLCDWKRGERRLLVKLWMGISSDEAIRMKDSRENWIQHTWPLIEKGMTRRDCLKWMVANGYPKPPRSACVFCPFHSDAEWLRLKKHEPEEFQKAVAYEKRLHEATARQEVLTGVPYLHSSLVPLSEVKFETLPSHQQLDLSGICGLSDETDGTEVQFGNECEGMCGV